MLLKPKEMSMLHSKNDTAGKPLGTAILFVKLNSNLKKAVDRSLGQGVLCLGNS